MKLDVINKTRKLTEPLWAKDCETYLCRLLGLMFRRSIDSGEGLLLVYKSETKHNAAIHMLFVGMDLGIIWLNSDKEIVDMQLAKSWHPLYTPKLPAKYVLEIHPKRLSEFVVGDRLDFEKNHQI
jgi:uncharacterized membrane protein (UPF0127 family)